MTLNPAGRDPGDHLLCEFDGLTAKLRPQDLSQAGVFVVTTTPPALDRELELRLHSAIGTIAVRGQVVQVISRARAQAEQRSPGFGVLFVDLEDDQRAWIGLTLDAVHRAEAKAIERARPTSDDGAKTVSTRPVPAATSKAPQRRIESAPPPDPAVMTARAEAQRKLAQRRDETLRRLEQTLAAVQEQSAWVMLGLEPGVDVETARRAYLACSKRYHPHVYAHLDSPEINRVATELFIAHKRAYGALNSLRPAPPAPTASQPPLEDRAPPPPKAVTVSMGPPRSINPPPIDRGIASRAPTTPGLPHLKRRVADTEIALSAGLKHLAASRFEEAAAELTRARTLCPERHDVTVWLHVCRARKLKACGRADAATEEYRAVLEHDPEHREALEHVGSGRSQRRRGGIIGKWFGTGNE